MTTLIWNNSVNIAVPKHRTGRDCTCEQSGCLSHVIGRVGTTLYIIFILGFRLTYLLHQNLEKLLNDNRPFAILAVISGSRFPEGESWEPTLSPFSHDMTYHGYQCWRFYSGYIFFIQIVLRFIVFIRSVRDEHKTATSSANVISLTVTLDRCNLIPQRNLPNAFENQCQ